MPPKDFFAIIYRTLTRKVTQSKFFEFHIICESYFKYVGLQSEKVIHVELKYFPKRNDIKEK